MISGGAAGRYLQTQVLTAPRERLVTLLYDAAYREAAAGAEAVAGRRWEEAARRLNKFQSIVTELRTGLDMSHGELPQRLDALYEWCQREVAGGLAAGAPDRIRKAGNTLAELREAWNQAVQGGGGG